MMHVWFGVLSVPLSLRYESHSQVSSLLITQLIPLRNILLEILLSLSVQVRRMPRNVKSYQKSQLPSEPVLKNLKINSNTEM